MYYHICLGNIKNLYKYAAKFDNKQQYVYIIDACIVSTPKGLTENIPTSIRTSVTINKPSTRKPLHQCYELFNVKQKTDVFR